MIALPYGTDSSSGDEILELLLHDALVKGAIVLVGVVLLVIGLVAVWKIASRPPRRRTSRVDKS